MQALVLYTLLTTAAYYLGARAKITSWLWNRYPPAFARFMDCAACSGFWFGLGFGAALSWFGGLPFLGLGAREWYTAPLIGLCSITWTPIAAGVMQKGFEWLGTTAPEDGA